MLLPPLIVALSAASELETAVMSVVAAPARTNSSAADPTRFVTPAPEVAVTEPFDVRLIVSTLEIEEPAGLMLAMSAVVVTLSTSAPAPPSILSRAVRAITPAAVLPVITSSPAPPVTLSRLVVSDQISVYGIDKYFNNLINDTISIFIVTYRIPT